jgi:hypothetical protein
MRGKLIKALWLLVTLDLMVVGICPRAPAALLVPLHSGQCQHERVPAGGPHSCCVSVHHQPALVRPMPENFSALSAPAAALKPLMQAAQIFPISKIALAPSPPILISALRV